MKKENLNVVDRGTLPKNYKQSHFDQIKNGCLGKWNLTVPQLIELKHEITKRVLSIPGVLTELGILNPLESRMSLNDMNFSRSKKITGVNTIVNIGGQIFEFHNHMDTLLTRYGYAGLQKFFFYREFDQYITNKPNFAGTFYFDASETVVLFAPVKVIRKYIGKDIFDEPGNEWKMTTDWSGRYDKFPIPCKEIYAFGNISKSHRDKFKTFDYSVNKEICEYLMKFIKETDEEYLDRLNSLEAKFF